jgi:4-carboxymuconolactone decarboxylase
MSASLARRGSPARLAPLLAFAAAMTVGDDLAAAHALQRARALGIARVAAEETALMLVLHAGYPAALEGARVLRETWPGLARRTKEGTQAQWMKRGTALCRRVYGAAFPKLVKNVAALHPDLARWMIEQGYGRVLTRAGLGGRERELVAVTVLAAGGWERQLVSHLLGADRLGATRAEVRGAFAAGRRRTPPHRRAGCARAWRSAFGA